MRPRVGHIQFLNCLPIYYGLVKGSGILDLDLARGTPTELNRALLRGDLDISPLSSIEYGRHADELLLLPGPTVSCRGPVKSILLLSRYPIEELGGKKVGLTGTSATSQVLVKIILEKSYKIQPEYFSFGEDPGEALGRGDAALLIGDAALESLDPAPGLLAYDLGLEWERFSGGGMVFAVWAVRRDFADCHPGLVRHVWKLFQDSIGYCTSNLGEIARDAARWEKFSPSFLEEYFRTLSFGFEEPLREGLLRFYGEAAGLGVVDGVPDLVFSHQPGRSEIEHFQAAR